MIRHAILALLALPLAACATFGSSAPQSPAQTVYALEGTYAAALNVAVAYRQLPTCVTGGPVICHDPAVVAKMVEVNDTARTALTGAQAVVTNTGSTAAQIDTAVAAATAVVMQFSALSQTVKVK